MVSHPRPIPQATGPLDRPSGKLPARTSKNPQRNLPNVQINHQSESSYSLKAYCDHRLDVTHGTRRPSPMPRCNQSKTTSDKADGHGHDADGCLPPHPKPTHPRRANRAIRHADDPLFARVHAMHADPTCHGWMKLRQTASSALEMSSHLDATPTIQPSTRQRRADARNGFRQIWTKIQTNLASLEIDKTKPMSKCVKFADSAAWWTTAGAAHQTDKTKPMSICIKFSDFADEQEPPLAAHETCETKPMLVWVRFIGCARARSKGGSPSQFDETKPMLIWNKYLQYNDTMGCCGCMRLRSMERGEDRRAFRAGSRFRPMIGGASADYEEVMRSNIEPPPASCEDGECSGGACRRNRVNS